MSPVLIQLETAAERLEEVTEQVRERILDLKNDPQGSMTKGQN